MGSLVSLAGVGKRVVAAVSRPFRMRNRSVANIQAARRFGRFIYPLDMGSSQQCFQQTGVRVPSGQANEGSSSAHLDLGGNLKELEADLAHRAYGQSGAGKHTPHLRQEDESDGMKEKPKAIGGELVTTGSA